MIFYETAGQERAFALLLCAGLGAGLLYDLFSLLRFRAPRWAGAALDILWGLAAALMCALGLAVSGSGRPRLYAGLGLLCGGGVYWAGVHSLLRSIFRFFQKRKPSPEGKGV